jgi:predicted PurR-regulated permease PerM
MNERVHRGEPWRDRIFVRRVVIVAAFAALAATVWLLSDVLLLVFGAILVASLLRAIADPLARGSGLPDQVALLLAGLGIVLVLATMGYVFGRQISSQLGHVAKLLPEAVQNLSDTFDLGSFTELMKGTSLGNLALRILAWGNTIFGVITGLLLVVFAGIYLAADPATYRAGLIKLFPPHLHPHIAATLDDSGHALRRWIIGQLLAMLLVGILVWLGLWLIGLPSALALGLIAGLTEFVPIIGPVVGAIPALLIASTHGLDMVLWTVGVFVAVQQIESQLIVPLVVGRVVLMPPAVGIFAVVAMGVLFGPLGLLFGFPLAVVVNVAVRRLYVRETLGEAVEIAGEKR